MRVACLLAVGVACLLAAQMAVPLAEKVGRQAPGLIDVQAGDNQAGDNNQGANGGATVSPMAGAGGQVSEVFAGAASTTRDDESDDDPAPDAVTGEAAAENPVAASDSGGGCSLASGRQGRTTGLFILLAGMMSMAHARRRRGRL